MTENKWRDRDVVPWLKELPDCYWFIKEAKGVRGIPDLVICINGKFAAWELKKSRAEAKKKTGRIALQKYNLKRVKDSGGHGRIVFPENLEKEKLLLLEYGFGTCKGWQLFDSLKS